MKSIKEILKTIDFISPEITLFYHGIDSHSSSISGILSIILLIGFFFLISYLSVDVIKKQNPTSFYYKKFTEDIDSYPLNSSSILHYIGVYSSSNLEVKINKKAINIIGININDGEFLKNTNISNYSHWIYENCEESDLGKFKDTYSEKDKDNFTNCFCISKYYDLKSKSIINKNDKNFIYPTLIHGASQFNNFEYGVYIQKCQNNTILNDNNCLPEIEQNSFLNKIIGYEIYFIDHSINVDDYKNPIIDSIHRITSEINSDSYTLNHLNFNPATIRTNDGIFLDNEKINTSYTYDYNEKITHNGNSIIGSFNFWMQNTEATYDRTYKKIQDIAGGADGIIEIVIFIIQFIHNFFIGGFYIIKDFSFEIEKNLNIKNNQNSVFNKNKKNNHHDNNNEINKKIQSQFITKTNSSNRSLVKRNYFITNSHFSEIVLSKNYRNTLSLENGKLNQDKKINWFSYILSTSKIKKYENIEYLNNKREEIISEEKLIEMYLNLEKIFDILKKDYNSNINIDGNDTKEEIDVKEIEKEDENINTNFIYSNTPSPLNLNNK